MKFACKDMKTARLDLFEPALIKLSSVTLQTYVFFSLIFGNNYRPAEIFPVRIIWLNSLPVDFIVKSFYPVWFIDVFL